MQVVLAQKQEKECAGKKDPREADKGDENPGIFGEKSEGPKGKIGRTEVEVIDSPTEPGVWGPGYKPRSRVAA